ncbi:A/G-specific adenine glycosylase [Aeribacillus alveayuensis]|uniref:Adenine DNA glycosylase n=1 Tax=Aeribacillus alveayuensis TaxID=279215 RepID=A0ABT9VQ17_9BACI|nr:A/G-specific adenine glycosylase [Bacillus alveayuensis]
MEEILQKQLMHFQKETFQRDLLEWYRREKRDLPWRKDQDPYKVWVSEIMLQQTRVDTVKPFFNQFIKKFPTIEALAEADEEEVLKAWEGLGYYSRARNLHSAVKEVKETYGGKVPDDPKQLEKLKGIGPYTKGAILSIAYNLPEPAVDGNVMRVVSRILTIWEDIAKPKTRKIFESVIREIISKEHPSDFNQALMELGALVCTPTSPSCLLCPVRKHCAAYHEGVEEELPVKTKTKAHRQVQIAAAVLKKDDFYYIHKRPSQGLLANLWEFPNCETKRGNLSQKKQLEQFLQQEYGIESTIGDLAGTIQHVFSHLTWNISVFFGHVKNDTEMKEINKVTKDEMNQYAFPVSHQKIFSLYQEQS